MPMEWLEYLRGLYDYHYWANARYLEAAAGLAEEQLRRPLGHSWGSVFGVLLHMLNAEWIWLRRWQGESPRTFLPAEDFPALADLRSYWAGHEIEMRRFVAAQTDYSLIRPVTYTNTAGVTYTLALWQMMVHVPNHGTHHRGELAAMFAMLEALHPEDEWLHYFLAQSGQKRKP